MVDSRRLKELSRQVVEQAPELAGRKVVVALSGGADSACAAWLAVQMGCAPRAMHVDHGLPGSPAMRAAAVAIAEHLEVDLEVVEVTIPRGASPESQAREVRYSALLGSLRMNEWLITGHTSDDQAETILMNILRGTGLDGLAGIPRSRDQIIRPILSVSRSDSRELAGLLGLPWQDDPANEENDPRRNQVRRNLIPHLESRFNPRIRSALVGLGHVASAATSGADRVQVREVEGGLALVAAELHAVGEVSAATALRQTLRRIRGPHPGTRAEVGRLKEVAVGAAATAELTGGVTAFREGPWLVISRKVAAGVQSPAPWRIPGQTQYGRWWFDAWIDDRPPLAYPLSSWRAVADADAVPATVTIRHSVPREKIDGTLTTEVLRRVGIPARERRSWPVIVSDEDVLWLPGARISRSVWVGEATRRYLWVQAGLETM